MTAEVIFLKFRSPHVEDDERAYLSCKNCRNKTYLLICDKPEGFPLMQCAACGQHMGRMGWSHDDDPVEEREACPSPKEPCGRCGAAIGELCKNRQPTTSSLGTNAAP